MVESNPPAFADGQCYTFEQFRQVFGSIVCVEGVVDRAAGELLVTADGGASVDVTVAAGRAWIQGDINGAEGMYRVYNDAAKPVTIDANGAGSDRIDLIIGSVYDSQYIGAVDQWAIEVVKGTAGAGVPAVPDSTRSGYIVFAQVTVPASGATPSVVADVRQAMSTCGGQPWAQISASAPTSCPDGVETKIALDIVDHEDTDFFTCTADRITIEVDGLYAIEAYSKISVADVSSGADQTVYLNNVTVVVVAEGGSGAGSGNVGVPIIRTNYPLVAGDYLEYWNTQYATGSKDASNGRLQVRKVG